MWKPRALAPPLACLALLAAVAASAVKPPPCPGGRYAVAGDRLLAGDVLPGPDDVFFTATQVAIASGCRTAPVTKLSGSKRGTTLKVTWEACGGATGKVKLKAKIDPSCQTLTGTLTAPKTKPRLKRKFSAALVSSEVRACDYVPGVSEPATMPPEVVDPPDPPPPDPLDPLPDPTPVSPEITAAQVDVLLDLWSVVDERYVYPDFNGVDWLAVGNDYLDLVEQGLTDDDFYAGTKILIQMLGDSHSQYLSPQDVAEQAAKQAAGKNFVGIGAISKRVPPEEEIASIIAVFPGSPAEEAGLRPHDLLLAVDGLPLFDDDDKSRTLGDEDTSFMLTFQRLGEAPQTIEITRRRVAGFRPMEACIVPGTRIGYIQLTDFLSLVVDDQIRAYLQDMTLEGPLEGLIVDNRLNGGGSSAVVEPTLGFFTDGLQGSFVSRDAERTLTAVAEDVGGSQTVPLVLLADTDTVSFAEIFTGVLGVSGRATIVGGPTKGNVELLHGYEFTDDSFLWIAQETFEPVGLPAAYWEDVGVQPDVLLRTRWDLFTEETDPALAEAVELLLAP